MAKFTIFPLNLAFKWAPFSLLVFVAFLPQVEVYSKLLLALEEEEQEYLSHLSGVSIALFEPGRKTFKHFRLTHFREPSHLLGFVCVCLCVAVLIG